MQAIEDEINTIEVSVEKYDPSLIPAEHCFYCLSHNPSSLLYCESSSRWFCAMICQKGSHISWHREFAGGSGWRFHSENPNRRGKIECEDCKSSELSMMTLVNQSIFCRKCTIKKKVENPSLVLEEILSNGKISPSVLDLPSEEEKKKCREINKKQIQLIENNLKQGIPEFTGLDSNNEFVPLTKIKRIYQDAREYSELYTQLLKKDMEYNKALSSRGKINSVSIEFNQRVGYFTYNTLETGLKLRVGSLIEIFESGRELCGAIVFEVNDQQNRVKVKILEKNFSINGPKTVQIQIKFLPIPFERMIESLEYFAKDCIDENIQNLILGKSLIVEQNQVNIENQNDFDFYPPNIPPLNTSQLNAVKSAISKNFSIIQGPPGTGKTHSCSAIVWNYNKLMKDLQKPSDKILVTSNSNIAVDNLVERIHKTGVSVVKVASRLREKIRNPNQVVERLSLHNLLRERVASDRGDIIDLFDMKYDYDEVLDNRQFKTLMDVVKPMTKDILSKFDVICCTNVVAADDRLEDFEYPFVLIDEANQSIEPESLIPLLFGCKKLVLVGDQMQLGPVSKCGKTVSAGLTRSLMTRMIHIGHIPSILKHQYRMHPSISSFPRNFFYKGEIIDGISESDRPSILDFWPNDTPNIFIHHESNEASTGGACSVSNTNESFYVSEVLQKLNEKGVNLNEVVVLTPYEAQKRLILELFQQKRLDVKVYNIDEFQGNESNYIVFSTVRSNADNDIGFLNDFRRLNVALTRAKFGMVVIGNCKTLSRTKLWSHLIKDYSDKHMIFEGMFGSLRVHNISIDALQEFKFDEEFVYSS